MNLPICTDAKTTAPGWSVPLLPAGKSARENPGVMPYAQEDKTAVSVDAVSVPKGKNKILGICNNINCANIKFHSLKS